MTGLNRSTVRRALAAALPVALGLTILPARAQWPQPAGDAGAAAVAGPTEAYDRAKAAFEALPEADRIAIQDALVWTGDYASIADGAFGRRSFEAVQAYQRRIKAAPSGIVDPGAQAALLAAAARAKMAAGWMIINDAPTGLRIGVPQKLLPKRTANQSGGTRFQSTDEKVTLDTRAAVGGEPELKELYDRNIAIQTPGRTVTYRLSRPDVFVISGETPGGRFYTRYATRDGALRGFSIGYDKTVATEYERIVIAISNSFAPFPSAPGARPAIVTETKPGSDGRPVTAPPQRREARSFTGLAVSPRRVLTTAEASESCREPLIDGAAARVVTVDRGLALLEPARPHAAGSLRLASGAADGAGLVMFVATGEGGQVVATPADFPAAGRLVAPLQDGAAGAVVLDRDGAIVGIVTVPASGARRVAGLVPPQSHPYAPVADLTHILGSDAPKPAGGGDSRGAALSALAPAIARVTCPASGTP